MADPRTACSLRSFLPLNSFSIEGLNSSSFIGLALSLIDYPRLMKTPKFKPLHRDNRVKMAFERCGLTYPALDDLYGAIEQEVKP